MLKPSDAMEVTYSVVTEIFNEFYPALVASAIRYVGDVETSRDIVSDCFLGLWTHRHNYIAEDCRRILFSSVRNRCFNELVRRKRLYANLTTYSPLSESMEYRVENKDLCRYIYLWMNSLPEKRRRVCELVYFRDMEPAEVARELGIGIATVISQSRRMTVALRDQVQTF